MVVSKLKCIILSFKFITGSKCKEAIEELKATVKGSFESGIHSISRNFYKWNGKKIEKV